MKAIVIFLLLSFQSLLLTAQKPEIGIAQSMENDSLLQASGYHYLVESISKCFSPRNVSDQQFAERLQAIKKMKTKLYAVNVFIPGELKLVGPDVNEQAVLSYAEIVFQRCNAADVALIVWGSGGARRVPDGWDQKKAKEQFVSIARKVSAIAKDYKIVLALENLNSTETNFMTTLSEALEIVQQVDHPNFRLCADIYHMLKENEQPAIIEQAGKYLVHCDLAEKENRTAPGISGDDFRGYLKALKKIKYSGKIILECRWDNLALQAAPARQYLQVQIDEVFNQK